MSSAALIGFIDGKAAEERDYRNSWGGAAYIWNYLWDKYLKRDEYDSWIVPKNAERLWKLGEDPRLTSDERACLFATFDGAIVRADHFERFSRDLTNFLERARLTSGAAVCHLSAWASFLAADRRWEAVGFWHTSVTDNPWMMVPDVRDEETGIEERAPYDLNAHDKHWEIYDEMDKLASIAPGSS